LNNFYEYMESMGEESGYWVHILGQRKDSYDFNDSIWQDIRMIVQGFVYEYLRGRGLFAGRYMGGNEINMLAGLFGDRRSLKKNRDVHPMSHHIPSQCLSMTFEGKPIEVNMPPGLSGRKFVDVGVISSLDFFDKGETIASGLGNNSNFVFFLRSQFNKYAKKYLGKILDPIGVDSKPYIMDMIRGIDCVLKNLLANYDAKRRIGGKINSGIIAYEMIADDEDISDLKKNKMPADFSDILDNIKQPVSAAHQAWLLSPSDLPDFWEAVRVGMGPKIKDRLLYNKLLKSIDYANKHGMSMSIRGFGMPDSR